MKTLKCVIIDDDLTWLSILKALIDKTPGLSLETSFTNPEEGAAYISSTKVDLLFLDMEMPKMTGIDILSKIPKLPPVIVVSSREKYALEAYDLDIVAYLVKPVNDYAKFLKAVKKARDIIEPTQESSDKIFIKVDSLLVNFDLSDIFFVQGFGDYVKIKTPTKTLLAYSTLQSVEDKLPQKDFVRIHRSYIVRIDKVTNIDKANLEIDGGILPISAKYKSQLLQRINTL